MEEINADSKLILRQVPLNKEALVTARVAMTAAVIILLTIIFSAGDAFADESCSHPLHFSATLARSPSNEGTAGPARELTSSCLACFLESFKIIRECGDKVWKGFGLMNVRANIVTPHYEFFFGDADAPEGYALLSGDNRIGRPIFYKKRDYRREFVSTIDPVAGRPAIFISSKEVFEKTYSHSPLYRIAEDYIFTIVGQCFQLYLRTENTVYAEKIKALLPELENLEKKYPYRDAVNANLLKLEGEQLLEAYQAKNPDITRECVLTMLRFRQMRLREMQDKCGINFTPYESWMEWSLGLSKYTEVQCAHSIISGNYKPTAGMRQVPNFKQYGFLKNKIHFELGRLNSTRNSLIHAALGMTEALVLDRTSIDWKEAIFRYDSSLIDILRESFSGKDGIKTVER